MLIRYDFEENLNSSLPQLIYFVKDQCAYAYHADMQSHNIAELYFILDGNGCLHINNLIFSLEKNSFVCINPYVPHGECVKKEQSFPYFILGISNLNIPESGNVPPNEPFVLPENSRISFLLNAIFEELTNRKVGYSDVVSHYFNILITELERVYNRTIAYISPALEPSIVRIKDYIDFNCFGNISSKFIAEMFHMKLNTLEIKFKKNYHVSIQQYILRKRIEDAQSKLKNDTSSITEIALRSGFSDPAYFSKYFKKITGMTPSDYRKLSKKIDLIK